MTKDKDRTVRNDAKILETLLLNENDLIRIKELVNLLEPQQHPEKIKSFAGTTRIIASDS